MSITRRFTVLEKTLKMLAGAISIPLAPLLTQSVKQNHALVVTRFGKVDRIASAGLRWIPVGDSGSHFVFLGTQTHTFPVLTLNEKNGTPLHVKGFVNYRITDAERYVTVANGKIAVFVNLVESAVREGLRKYPFIGATEGVLDIRGHSDDICHKILTDGGLNTTVAVYGITIDAIKLTEVTYAPEIAQQMLLRQQAEATIAAREAIVTGALGIVQSTVAKLPELSAGAREQMISNLMVTLTSRTEVTPTLPLR